MTINIAIADDHLLVRQGVRRYLEAAEDIQVVGEASNGVELCELVAHSMPDVVLVDVKMPEMDGLEAARRIHERHPGVGIVMLTVCDDGQSMIRAVRNGARGYLLKARDADNLISTVRLVAQGNMVIDPQLASGFADELSEPRWAPERPTDTLTGRETEILQLLAFGSTNRDVGERLFISPDTVKSHLERIFEKLGASDRTAAVAEALRRRIID